MSNGVTLYLLNYVLQTVQNKVVYFHPSCLTYTCVTIGQIQYVPMAHSGGMGVVCVQSTVGEFGLP